MRLYVVGRGAVGTYFGDALSRAGVDVIDHPQLLARRRCRLFHRHLGVEVPASLQIIGQVAPAFVQQIIVQRILMVNRDFSSQHTSADGKTLGVYHDHGTGVDQEGKVDGVGFGMVFLFGDGNLGQDALLLLQLLAQVLKRVGDTARAASGRCLETGSEKTSNGR